MSYDTTNYFAYVGVGFYFHSEPPFSPVQCTAHPYKLHVQYKILAGIFYLILLAGIIVSGHFKLVNLRLLANFAKVSTRLRYIGLKVHIVIHYRK